MKNDPATLTSLHQSNLNLLVNLAVLLDEAHVSRAAERLGMTQSAISHVLNRARELFDDPLLIKGSKGMILTNRAQALKRQLTEFAQVTSLVFQGAEFDASRVRGVIRFSMNDLAASLCIEALLSIFAEQAPFLELELVSPSEHMAAQLSNGHLDFAIGAFNQLPDNCHSIAIGSEPWHLLQGQYAKTTRPLTHASYALAESMEFAQTQESKQLGSTTSFRSSSLLVMLAALKTEYFGALVPNSLLHLLLQQTNNDSYSHSPMGYVDNYLVWPQHLTHQPMHEWARAIFFATYQQYVLLSPLKEPHA
ncbi:LysR family transcriptional regulator [Motilimonas eburnea]|uniref:LysR family transcriptional regulator n=1 Tax=Motilimonas eburnea TaxID=1737488 RepID=UPI001E35EE74|nr:LysR family transcriptional regulator [Motilimonas eburnea]MCE2572019.1 LysR family transcriptional regulator [Motilimonas eburnea]